MKYNWIFVRCQETLKKSISIDDSMWSESRRLEAFRASVMTKWLEEIRGEREKRDG